MKIPHYYLIPLTIVIFDAGRDFEICHVFLLFWLYHLIYRSSRCFGKYCVLVKV